jgi:ankyrin repeat protein
VPKPKSHCDELPLHCAARLGDLSAIASLVSEGADLEARDDDSLTPLMSASTAAAAQALLSAGAAVDTITEDGMDALSLALASQNIELARALLEAGAPRDLINRFGLDRIGSAAFGRCPDSIAFLIESGSSLAPQSDSGMTVLHLVCWHGAASEDLNEITERVIRMLIEAGVPPDARDCFGQAPMHLAAAGEGPSCTTIRSLLKHGAKPDPIDHNGRTPLSLAGEDTLPGRILLDAGAKRRSSSS